MRALSKVSGGATFHILAGSVAVQAYVPKKGLKKSLQEALIDPFMHSLKKKNVGLAQLEKFGAARIEVDGTEVDVQRPAAVARRRAVRLHEPVQILDAARARRGRVDAVEPLPPAAVRPRLVLAREARLGGQPGAREPRVERPPRRAPRRASSGRRAAVERRTAAGRYGRRTAAGRRNGRRRPSCRAAGPFRVLRVVGRPCRERPRPLPN